MRCLETLGSDKHWDHTEIVLLAMQNRGAILVSFKWRLRELDPMARSCAKLRFGVRQGSCETDEFGWIGTSWDTVFRAVEQAVRWGLQHRRLDDIRAIGVDEFAWKKGHKYLTMVYQIDHGRRRLLHIARERTTKSFNTFFDMLATL